MAKTSPSLKDKPVANTFPSMAKLLGQLKPFLPAFAALHAMALRLDQSRRQGQAQAWQRAQPHWPPALPLIVTCGLRLGGSGKTALALALARTLTQQGLKVGFLLMPLQIRRGPLNAWQWAIPAKLVTAQGQPSPYIVEKLSHPFDWRLSSDEAVMLAGALPSLPIWMTTDRAGAWQELSKQVVAGTLELDMLIADDGMMDPRLQGAYFIGMRDQNESTSFRHLWPAGPNRATEREWSRVQYALQPERRLLVPPALLPQGNLAATPWIVVTTLGHPERLLTQIHQAGIPVLEHLPYPDHGHLPWQDLIQKALAYPGPASHHRENLPRPGFLMTLKEAAKLPSAWKKTIHQGIGSIPVPWPPEEQKTDYPTHHQTKIHTQEKIPIAILDEEISLPKNMLDKVLGFRSGSLARAFVDCLHP